MLGVLLTIPLLTSIVSFFWARFFQDDENFPGGKKVHTLLIMTQLIITTWVFSSWKPELSRYFLSGIYLIQAGGVSYYLLTKGRVSCGCFGSQVTSSLNAKLVVFNLFLSILSLISINDTPAFTLVEGVFLEIIMGLLCLVAVVGIPDALHAIKGYKRVADRYYHLIRK